MNIAEEAIVRQFRDAEIKAEACLGQYEENLNYVPNDEVEDLYEEMQEVHALLISERILLDAFKESDETQDADILELIKIARRKIELPSYPEVISDSYIQQNNVRAEFLPSIKQVHEYLEFCFRETIQILLQHEIAPQIVND